MFFDSPDNFADLSKRTNFVIFALDSAETEKRLSQSLKTSVLFLRPDEKTGKISVEMVRDFATLTDAKDGRDRFFAVLNAETMTAAAQNAFLKNLEEPQLSHHFILVTKTPSALLPTVLSRAQIFYLREASPLSKPVDADEKIKTLAKRLITANTAQLLDLANEISKKKDNPRAYALEITGAAIEILYKSYFATNEQKFLKKLPHLLKLHENLAQNGHIKLHIVADML